jgi:GGDEF domain-containing protein
MTTYGGSRSRRWLGAWLLLLVALGVAAATGYGIMRVHDYAGGRGQLTALLNRIETGSRHQSAVEWQAVAEGRLIPELALPNRALLVERLQAELARAARRREPVFLLWLDLDDFKVVNDSLGHQAGDQLLVAVGERLRPRAAQPGRPGADQLGA